MTDVIGIIDKIIEEHKILLNQATQFEKITNDAGAMIAMTKSKEVFMPGRLEQSQSLKKFEDLRNKIQEGLSAHFQREETSLLEAILEFGDKNIIITLKKLLSQHWAFRTSLKDLQYESNELINGQLSRALWEPKAYIMRSHIAEMHTRLEQHAKNEQQLFNDVRKQLIKAKE
jgi:hypothetical protein